MIKRFLPDIYQDNIFKINYDKLKEKKIKCLLFDLDLFYLPIQISV